MILVHWIRTFVGFWVDFIIGDDWTVAATVGGALVATWVLHRPGIDAWWLLPIAAVGATAVSIRRASSGKGI